jgi:hypothetical protein
MPNQARNSTPDVIEIAVRVAGSGLAASKADVARWQLLLQEHAGVSKSVAADIAKNLVSSGRDLPALARQKRWADESVFKPALDGTTLAIGCWKIWSEKRPLAFGEEPPSLDEFARMLSEGDPQLAKLMELADSVGVDPGLFDEALSFMQAEEAEQEWAKYAAIL